MKEESDVNQNENNKKIEEIKELNNKIS